MYSGHLVQFGEASSVAAGTMVVYRTRTFWAFGDFWVFGAFWAAHEGGPQLGSS